MRILYRKEMTPPPSYIFVVSIVARRQSYIVGERSSMVVGYVFPADYQNERQNTEKKKKSVGREKKTILFIYKYRGSCHTFVIRFRAQNRFSLFFFFVCVNGIQHWPPLLIGCRNRRERFLFFLSLQKPRKLISCSRE